MVTQRSSTAAAELAKAVGAGAGGRALDLGSGRGDAARHLARAGWSVEAIAMRPARTGPTERGDVRWTVAEPHDLPLATHSFDLVASSFGLVFAEHPLAALREAARVLVPGGLLALTAWTSESRWADVHRLMADLLPDAPDDVSSTPLHWGEPSTIRSWLAESFTPPETYVRTERWSFPGSDRAADFLFTHSPSHAVAQTMADEAGMNLRRAIRDRLDRDGARRQTIVDLEYTITLARSRRI